jgi:hypothetical protein
MELPDDDAQVGDTVRPPSSSILAPSSKLLVELYLLSVEKKLRYKLAFYNAIRSQVSLQLNSANTFVGFLLSLSAPMTLSLSAPMTLH